MDLPTRAELHGVVRVGALKDVHFRVCVLMGMLVSRRGGFWCAAVRVLTCPPTNPRTPQGPSRKPFSKRVWRTCLEPTITPLELPGNLQGPLQDATPALTNHHEFTGWHSSPTTGMPHHKTPLVTS
eukprot:11583570-Alexandrium_andersonii.AAC.1